MGDPSLDSTLRGYLQAIRECDAARIARFLDPAGLNRHQNSLREIAEQLIPYGQDTLVAERLGLTSLAELRDLSPVEYGIRLLSMSLDEVREAGPQITILSVQEEEDQARASYRVELEIPEFGLHTTENEISLQRRGQTWFVCFEAQGIDAWVAKMLSRLRALEGLAERDRPELAIPGESLEAFALWGVRDFESNVLQEPIHEYEDDLDDFPGVEECDVETFAIWGFRNELGETVLEPRFQRAESFAEGFAAVRLLGRWGFLGAEGKLAIPPVYVGAGDFSEGLAAVATGDPLEPRWGYLDIQGEFVIRPRFERAREFSEGLAAVGTGDPDEPRWGYIDPQGAFVLEPGFEEAGPFHEGRASVSLDGVWGIVDREGRFELDDGEV